MSLVCDTPQRAFPCVGISVSVCIGILTRFARVECRWTADTAAIRIYTWSLQQRRVFLCTLLLYTYGHLIPTCLRVTVYARARDVYAPSARRKEGVYRYARLATIDRGIPRDAYNISCVRDIARVLNTRVE